jgi:hypothetical protein
MLLLVWSRPGVSYRCVNSAWFCKIIVRSACTGIVFYSESEHLISRINFFLVCLVWNETFLSVVATWGGGGITRAFEVRKLHICRGEGIRDQSYFVLRKRVANTYRVLALTKGR